MNLPHLPADAQYLVKMGYYGLYECTYDSDKRVQYVLTVSGKEGACACGGGGKPEYWLLDKNGMALTHLRDRTEIKFTKVVYL